MSKALLELARRHGPLPEGHARVVVLEPDGRVHVRDMTSPREAMDYARDVAWETEDDRGPPVVGIFCSLDD